MSASDGDARDSAAAVDEAAGLTQVAGGDAETIRLMRMSMRMFTRQEGVSVRLRGLVEQMLEGRATIHDVMHDPEFDSIISTRLDKVAKAVEALPEHERPSLENYERDVAKGREPTTDHQLSVLMRRADPQGARLADRDEVQARGDDDGDLTGWFTARH